MLNSQSNYDGIAAPWSLMAPEPPKQGAIARQAATAEAAGKGPKAEDGKDMFGEDGLTFSDFLDVINPLQHIPVISSIYRAVTGDEISPGARMAGGTLYGGPVGLAGAVVVNAVEEHSGAKMEDRVLALFNGEETETAGPAQASGTGNAAESESGKTVMASTSEEAVNGRPAEKIVDIDPQLAERLNALATASGSPLAARSKPSNGTVAASAAPGSVDFSHLAPKPVPVTEADYAARETAPINPMATASLVSQAAPQATSQAAGAPSAANTPPRKGPVPALTSRSRLSPDVAQQLARIVERRRALGQEQLVRQTANPVEQTAQPGGTAILKGDSATPPEPQVKEAALQPDRNHQPPAATPAGKTSATARNGVPSYMPDPVPLQNVPDAMKAALEKYQAMLARP